MLCSRTKEKGAAHAHQSSSCSVNSLSTNTTGATVHNTSILSFLAVSANPDWVRKQRNLGEPCKPLLCFGISFSFKIALAFQERAMWRRAGVKVKVVMSKAPVCFYQGEALSAPALWISSSRRQDFCLKCWSHLDMCLKFILQSHSRA